MSQNDTGSSQSSESAEPGDPSSIGDDRLPEDLVASDDNPLAEGLPAGEDVHLRDEGKRAEEMDEPADETGDETGDEHDG